MPSPVTHETPATEREPARPRVSVVIVTYRSAQTIGRTLAALQPLHERGAARVLVVDNCSDDGTAQRVAEGFPWATLIRSPANVGFGRGNNLALPHVDTPYVLFLNPDAWITAEDLDLLTGFLEAHPEAGIVGPAIENDGRIDQNAGAFPTPLSVIRTALIPLLPLPPAARIQHGAPPFRADWVCGACLLIRKDLLDRLGGFDPRYFLYFEETDLCRRALSLGFQTWTVGAALARHTPGHSARTTQSQLFGGCIAEHYFQSRFHYMRKHHGVLAAGLAELTEVASFALKAGLRALVGKRRAEHVARLRAPILQAPPVRA
ncbi:MAG: glycosyltransferase family 2 protein [Planctomycetes bacterium]|nr:glycosyltransferase family 2 protein [Planctomycetota bacterium]